MGVLCGFDDKVGGKLIARPASCYTCHEAHAAVDTTFVQFYPTLVKLAEAKGTMSPAYLKEIAVPARYYGKAFGALGLVGSQAGRAGSLAIAVARAVVVAYQAAASGVGRC